VSEAADDVRVTNTVERNGFVLEIFNQCALKVCVGHALQHDVQSFDNDRLRLSFSRAQVSRHVDFSVAAAPQAVQYLVATIEQGLLKFEFRHVVCAFISVFIYRAGSLDAGRGWIVAKRQAWGGFIKYL
jgi:hypothetical protein